MQSCEYWQERIEEYLDGGLADDEKQNFLTHISSCSECREAFDMAKAVRAALSELPAIEVPDDFCDKLHERLEKEQQKHTTVIAYTRRCAMIAACIVIAVAVNAGNLREYFDKSGDELALSDKTAIVQNTDKQQPEEDNVYGDVSAPDAAPEIETGDMVISTPTEEKRIEKKTQAAAPAATFLPEATPEQSTTITPPEQTQAPINSEAGVIMQGSAAENDEGIAEDLSEAAVFSAQAAEDTSMAGDEAALKQAGGSGGSSGGGSAAGTPYVASAAPARSGGAEAGSIGVDAGDVDAVRTIADKYALPVSGVYSMSIDAFEQFIQELEQNGISYEDNTVREDTVIFSISEY